MGHLSLERRWLWDSYDHLLALLAINLLMGAALAPLWLIGLGRLGALISSGGAGAALLQAGLLLALLMTATLWLWAGLLAEVVPILGTDRSTPFKRVLAGLFRFDVLRWSLLGGFVSAALPTSALFYFRSEIGGASVSGFLGALCLWVSAGWLAVLVASLPVLLAERKGTRAALLSALRLLLIDTRLMGRVLLLMVLLWGLAVVLKFAGIFLFAFSLTAVLMNAAHAVARARRSPPDPNPAAATTWKEREQLERELEDLQLLRKRYQRTIRDVLRPWE
jgi:hypothetical protein